jgi:hypothetical protein
MHRSQQLRRIGWLLTPLVVWAASFLGAWAGAGIAARAHLMDRGVELMAGGAVIAALGATALWLLLLRRGLRGAAPSDTRESAE